MLPHIMLTYVIGEDTWSLLRSWLSYNLFDPKYSPRIHFWDKFVSPAQYH